MSAKSKRTRALTAVQQAMLAVRDATAMTEAEYDVVEQALIQRLGTQEERSMVAKGLVYGKEGFEAG